LLGLGSLPETLGKEGAVVGFLVMGGKGFVTSGFDGYFRDANGGGVWLVFPFGAMSENCSSAIGVT